MRAGYVEYGNEIVKGTNMKLMTYAAIGAIALAAGTSAMAESHSGMDQAAIIEMALAGGDAAAGEKVFKKCKACHMIGDGAKTRTGPILTGIVGRTLGTNEDFTKYSDTMEEMGAAGVVWDIESLNAFLLKPKDFVTKTKMSFAGLKSDEQRADLIAYLATFAE